MNKKKKIFAGILIPVIAICAISGIVSVVRNANKKPVMVVSAGELNYGGGWNSSEMQGIITSDVSQDVYVSDTQTVSQVLVKEGDVVNEGDTLLVYDTTLTGLNLEREKLSRQQIELNISAAEENLKKLQNTKPVSDNSSNDPGFIIPEDPGFIIPDDPGELIPEEPTPEPVVTPTPEPTVEPSNEYKISFVSNGHGTAPDDVVLNKGSNFQEYLSSLSTEEQQQYLPTEDGYIFRGWYTDQICTVSFDPEQEIDSDITLYAKWSEASPDYSDVTAYEELTKESLPYNMPSESDTNENIGTILNPYRYLCTDNAVITSGFMNMLKAKADEAINSNPEAHYYFMLEVHENNTVAGSLQKAWLSDAALLAEEFPENWQGTINLAGGTIDASLTDPESKNNESVVYELTDFDKGIIKDDVSYTKDELDKAIREQEENLKSLNLDLKESELKIKEAENAVKEGSVKAKFNGVVRKAGDPSNPPTDGSALLSVSSSEGLFVKGAVSELHLNELKEGDKVNVMSWQSGTYCEGTVRDILPYPDESGMFMSGDNASYYPFTVYIDSGIEGFTDQEWVSLTVTDNSSQTQNSGALYLWKAFIREEGGEKYVYKRDEDGKLIRQPITVGQLSGSGYEIISGVTWDDWLAFPYGSDVKDGAETREGTVSELYGY